MYWMYDSKLNFVKKIVAEGALSPMHVTAAVFLGEGPMLRLQLYTKGEEDGT
jgi:hypothetical protein